MVVMQVLKSNLFITVEAFRLPQLNRDIKCIVIHESLFRLTI